MTGMEQGLRYIEREIRFMVKDQFGNSTYAKYADRVIEDACGIPNFCTTVLSSKRPLTAILRAVRGPRGDVIMKFFNASLHDARIEMVMVLAEAIKLRSHHNKASRDAHEYLMKLYKKAIKKTVRLITGSKNKESYKSMYRSLRSFARMDDFDYDEDDEDDDFFSDEEFGDSEFAERCLEAYRDGKLPPEPAIGYSGPKLTGNEEILGEITAIEAKLGRHLTDAELDRLLCGDEEENVESDYPTTPKPGMDSDKIDSLADAIYNRVMEKLSGVEKNTPQETKFETLEDFLDRQQAEPNEEVDKGVTTVDLGKNPDPTIATEIKVTSTPSFQSVKVSPMIDNLNRDTSLEQLVDMHNHIQSATVEEESEEDSDLPPNDELGGSIEEDIVEVEVDYDPDEEEEIVEDSNEEVSEAAISSELTGECPPHMEHALMIGEVINDFSVKVSEQTQLVKNRIKNYFDRLGVVDITEITVNISPSPKEDSLLRVIMTVRVVGDYETINLMHLNTVMLVYVKDLAKILDIPEEYFDTDLRVVESQNILDGDLSCLNNDNDNHYNGMKIDSINQVLSSLVVYAYRRLSSIDTYIGFIDPPGSDGVKIYFISKNQGNVSNEYLNFFNTELIGEGIIDEVLNTSMVQVLSYETTKTFDEYLSEVNKVLDNNLSKNTEWLSNMIERIQDYFSLSDIEATVEEWDQDLSMSSNFAIIDVIYRVGTSTKLDDSTVSEFERQMKTDGWYSVCIEDALRCISNDIEVNSYFVYGITSNEDDSENMQMTSSFGI